MADLESFLCLLWDLQEVSQPWKRNGAYRGISVEELRVQLGWSQTRFDAVLDALLNDSGGGVIRTPSGGIAITW